VNLLVINASPDGKALRTSLSLRLFLDGECPNLLYMLLFFIGDAKDLEIWIGINGCYIYC